MAKITDFDKYIKERKKTSPKFTLFGEDYHIPPSLPYKAMLYIQQLTSKNKDEVIEDDDLLYFFELLFGNTEAVEKWKANTDFDIDLINYMVGWVLDQYGMASDPKQEPPQTKAVQD